MTNLGQAFDSNQHEDMGNFDPIPVGEYVSQVISSDIKQTKDKKGEYLQLEFEIIQGDYKGRKIWQNLNIKNLSPQTVEIAKKELATLCRSAGKPVIQDSQELHGIPIFLKVRIKQAKGGYPPQNVPAGYRQYNKVVNPSLNEKETVGTPVNTDNNSKNDDIPWDN